MMNLQNNWELGIASSVIGENVREMSSGKPDENCVFAVFLQMLQGQGKLSLA